MKLVVILSYSDNYLDRVFKLKDEGIKEVDYYYIEDIENKVDFSFLKDSIVYFLTNNIKLLSLISKIEMICKIINLDYLKENCDKFELQEKLNNNNINVPQHINYSNINKRELPIFCKSKKHDTMILKIYSMNTLNELFNKFNKEDFYFEKEVVGKEYKVYYVNKQVFIDDNMEVPSELQNLVLNIAECLKLDLCSLDIIHSNNCYYVIDVNPAPGFWLSQNSRIALLNIND